MPAPVTARPGRFVISLGDGGSPEAFVAPCGFTSKSFTWSRNLAEVTIPDCDDPDAPFWQSRDVESLSCSVSGEGVLAAEAVPTWLAVLNSLDAVNVQIEITFTNGSILLIEGAMQMESLELGAQQGQRVSINVSMQSDGPMTQTWTTA